MRIGHAAICACSHTRTFSLPCCCPALTLNQSISPITSNVATNLARHRQPARHYLLGTPARPSWTPPLTTSTSHRPPVASLHCSPRPSSWRCLGTRHRGRCLTGTWSVGSVGWVDRCASRDPPRRVCVICSFVAHDNELPGSPIKRAFLDRVALTMAVPLRFGIKASRRSRPLTKRQVGSWLGE